MRFRAAGRVSNPYRNILSEALFRSVGSYVLRFQSLQEYPKRGEWRDLSLGCRVSNPYRNILSVGDVEYVCFAERFPILTGIS